MFPSIELMGHRLVRLALHACNLRPSCRPLCHMCVNTEGYVYFVAEEPKCGLFIFRLVKHCIEGHAVHICKGRSSGVLCVAQTITSLYNLSSAHM